MSGEVLKVFKVIKDFNEKKTNPQKVRLFQWRWRESNPRPNKESERFLHV